MRITRHDRSDIVELNDGSAWRIWPADATDTLQWLSTTKIDVADVDDEICSHALVNRSDGSRVRVIRASEGWPIDDVCPDPSQGLKRCPGPQALSTVFATPASR